MKDIFHDLYAKVLSFFTSAETTEDPTKGRAMDRLKTVLMQDRAGFSERAIQMMKEELVSVVSKYMEIDDENFQLQIDAIDAKTVLDLSIPVIRPKTDEEIDEAIKEQSLKNQRKAEEIVKELESLIKEKAMALVGDEVDNDLIVQAQKNVEDKEEAPETEENEEEEAPEETEMAEETENPENKDDELKEENKTGNEPHKTKKKKKK